jgi:hypothetical protein
MKKNLQNAKKGCVDAENLLISHLKFVRNCNKYKEFVHYAKKS